MTDTSPSTDRRMRRLSERVRSATPAASPDRNREGRARLIAAVERMQHPSRGRSPLLVLAFAAAMAAVALVWVRARPTQVALQWHVVNGAASARGYVSVPAAAPDARLVFDDGSAVTLSGGSRARVAGTTPLGAEVVLEEGRASVKVQHRSGTRWVVDAGPFAVRVTGTEFVVAWAEGAVDVWMASGRVEVTGPILGEALTLTAGQHLHGNIQAGTVQIDDGGGSATAEPGPSEAAPDPAPSPSTVQRAEPLPRSVRPANPAPTWASLVASGDFSRVLQEAGREGVDRVLASHSLTDLVAMGDAARYGRDAPLARRTYETVRSRFPASGEARTAAFLLGRAAEEHDHSNADALRWYDAYLTEAPAGPFAGDALGRKMVIVSKTQGREAAKAIAARYLGQFPDGPYAAPARDLAP